MKRLNSFIFAAIFIPVLASAAQRSQVRILKVQNPDDGVTRELALNLGRAKEIRGLSYKTGSKIQNYSIEELTSRNGVDLQTDSGLPVLSLKLHPVQPTGYQMVFRHIYDGISANSLLTTPGAIRQCTALLRPNDSGSWEVAAQGGQKVVKSTTLTPNYKRTDGSVISFQIGIKTLPGLDCGKSARGREATAKPVSTSANPSRARKTRRAAAAPARYEIPYSIHEAVMRSYGDGVR